MKTILAIIIMAVLVLVLASQIDDDLSEPAKDLIGRLEEGAASKSYLYLLGFFAKEDENPEIVGKKLFEEYRKAMEDDAYEPIDYPQGQMLPLPKGEAFCRLWEGDCLNSLFSSDMNTHALFSENKTLVARFATFLEFNEYTTLSKPTASEIYPPYRYITAAERIVLLQAISVYKNGDAGKAMDLLFTQFSTLRKAMELQDNLIGKLVLLMQLSDIIDIASLILSNEHMEAKNIPELTPSEKSFYMIAAREFGMSFHTFKKLDKNPDFFEMGGRFPGWITRMLYKPNMTINAIAPIYYQLEKLAEMSPSDFAKHVNNKKESIRPSTSKLRNYVGHTLISISPEFHEWVARFFDLDAKIALFNQLHHFKQPLGRMTNPYYGNEKPTETHGRLCFSGPLEDTRSLRCVGIKI